MLTIMLKKISNFILLLAYLTAPVWGQAQLPPIDIDFNQVVIPEHSGNYTIIRGQNYDLESRQQISSRNEEQLKQLLDHTLKSEIDYKQVRPLQEQIEFIFKSIGYVNASVSVENLNNRGIFVADGAGPYNRPQKVDHEELAKSVAYASRKRVTTAAGAAYRNAKAENDDLNDFFSVSSDNSASNNQELEIPEIIEISASSGSVKTVSANDDDQGAEIAETLQTAGTYAQAYLDAEDKEEYLKSLATGYIAGQADQALNSFFNGYDGINAELSLGIKDLENFEPSGKFLFPLYSGDKHFIFAQTGLTYATNDRQIFHAGLGVRFYPEAVSAEDLGSYMFGLNTVFDFDTSRGHKRMSVGAEFMNDYVALSGNFYRRISGWKSSYDFESAYVEERPASGFDLRAKVFMPKKEGYGRLTLTADVTHWMGKDIAPFGASSTEDLEDSPWIFAAGFDWQIVPAISLAAKHSFTTGGAHQNEIMLNWTIPFGEYDFKHAFDPAAVNGASGFDLKTSKSMFINRDYTMPLQYRATPGKFHIKYCGLRGDNKYCFAVKDGLNRPAVNLNVNVTSKDQCVKLSNNGEYITDGNGEITAEIVQACKTHTTLHVKAGDSEDDFEVTIQKMTLKINATPPEIPRYATSKITLSAGPGIAGTRYKWSLVNAGDDAAGSISGDISSDVWDANNETSVIFKPNVNAPADYDATIQCEVYGNIFTQVVHVKVYGTSSDSLNFADGRDVIEGNEIIALIYDSLEHGSSVTYTGDGEGLLFESQNDDGSFNNSGSQITVKDLDNDGKITIYIKGNDVNNDLANPAKFKITAQTEDQTFNLQKTIGVYSYIPSSSSDANVDPGRVYTVTVSDLKDGTYAEFNDSPIVFADGVETSGKITRDPSYNGNSPRVLVSGGRAVMKYKVADDVYKGTLKGMSVKYYRNVGVPETVYTEIPEVTVNTFDPALHANFRNFSEGDIVPLRVTDGLEDQKLVWNVIAGAGVLAGDENGLDERGRTTITRFGDGGIPSESRLYFKGLKPAATPEKIKIEVHTMADTLDTDHMYGDDDSSASDNKYNSWDNQVLTVPAVLEYKASDVINLSGLKPGSKAVITIDSVSKVNDASATAVSTADVPLNVNEVTADDAGNANVNIEGVENFNLKDFSVKAKVAVTSAEDKELPLQMVPMQAHALAATRVNNASLVPFMNNDANEQGYIDVKVTGGFAGENVKLVLDPSSAASFSATADVKNADHTFDADGSKIVRLYSYGNFSGTPQITASGIERSTSLAVPYSLISLTPTVNLPTLAADSVPMKLYSAAVADGGAKYVDFNTASAFTVSGLLKNSAISASAGGVALTCTATDATGSATCTLPAFTDTPDSDVDCTSRKVYFSTKDIKVNYVDPAQAGYTDLNTNNAQTSDVLRVYQYALTVSVLDPTTNAAKSEIYGDETAKLLVTGAHPGTPVTFTLSGDGTASASSCTPDANGQCFIIIQGKSPYATAINATVSSEY